MADTFKQYHLPQVNVIVASSRRRQGHEYLSNLSCVMLPLVVVGRKE